METRDRVHQLIDHFSEDDLLVVERFLDRLQETAEDPVQHAFLKAATLEPEVLSVHDIAALDEISDEDEYVSHEDVRRMLLSDR